MNKSTPPCQGVLQDVLPFGSWGCQDSVVRAHCDANPPLRHLAGITALLPCCTSIILWSLLAPISSFPWELLLLKPSVQVSHPGRMWMGRLLIVPRDDSRQCNVLTSISTAQLPSLPGRHTARLPAPCPQEVSQ